MKVIKVIIALALLGVMGMGSAWADRGGHVRFGVSIGVPIGPWYYPPPYYYPPYSYYPPVVVQQPAPVYVEQQQAPVAPAAAPAATNYWYYCAAAKGYYPYVKECPGGWERVLPQPPGPPQ